MKKKNSSTDHRWMLLKKCPTPVKCHQPGPFEREDRARGDDHDQRTQRQHAEHVDPRGDIGRLAVGQQLLRRQRRRRRARAAAPSRIARLEALTMSLRSSAWPGNGARIATANTTSISTITTTFDTDIGKKCQWTVCAGWLRLKIAPSIVIGNTGRDQDQVVSSEPILRA